MKKKPFSEIPRLGGGRLLLRRITHGDADALAGLARSEAVYRYLPTFLYEQKYPDIHRVIDGLYAECLEESLILGSNSTAAMLLQDWETRWLTISQAPL